jgi:hypothetical protein
VISTSANAPVVVEPDVERVASLIAAMGGGPAL